VRGRLRLRFRLQGTLFGFKMEGSGDGGDSCFEGYAAVSWDYHDDH
jgi:hypothetical protein